MTNTAVSSEGAPASRAGLRRTTTASLAARNYARRYGTTAPVTRGAALRLAKRVAPCLGLKGVKIALIDQLFASSKAVDWTTPGVAPIVWPSNDFLARRLGLSVSDMRYHLGGLVEAGLIAYSDSPTYQRWGRRDGEGIIVEGCGINLAPLAVRFEELTAVADAGDAEGNERKRLRARRTVLGKAIRSLIGSGHEDGVPRDWGHIQARLDVIMEGRACDSAAIAEQVEALEALESDAEDIWNAEDAAGAEVCDEEGHAHHFDDQKHTSALSNIEHHTTTDQLQDSVNSSTGYSVGLTPEKSNILTASGRMAFREKPARAADAVQNKKSNPGGEDIRTLSMPLVQNACRDLDRIVPGALDDWASLRDRGRALCEAVNINPQVWQEACNVLGPDRAVAAVAVTVQKSELGTVDNPGAYLRTLVRRGGDGRLHISRSLFALAAQARRTHGETGNGEAPPEIPAVAAFPGDGAVSYTPWAEVIRTHTPAPVPDVDMLADAFRRWTSKKGIDLTSPNIERILISFCRKWHLN